MTSQQIIRLLPYSKPFLFVDELINIDENSITGNYTFDDQGYFYKGHFKNNPVTPGVIITETMAQIGVVSLGIYLLKDTLSSNEKPQIALTSSEVDFYLPVFPNEKITVVSEKIYFRFNKLKCKIKVFNERKELVSKGTISGMFKNEA